jgi:hypothetical protein
VTLFDESHLTSGLNPASSAPPKPTCGAVFQLATTNFWHAPAASGQPSPALTPAILRFADMTAPGAAVGALPPDRIFSSAGTAAGSGPIGWRRFCPPCRSRSPAYNELGQLASAPESVPVQTRRIAKNRNRRIMRSPRLCKATVPKMTLWPASNDKGLHIIPAQGVKQSTRRAP